MVELLGQRLVRIADLRPYSCDRRRGDLAVRATSERNDDYRRVLVSRGTGNPVELDRRCGRVVAERFERPAGGAGEACRI